MGAAEWRPKSGSSGRAERPQGRHPDPGEPFGWDSIQGERYSGRAPWFARTQGDGLPLLGPWQSAGAVTHVAHVSNKVRTQDLLIKTKDALKETQKQEEENGGKEGKGSSRGLEPA